MASFLSQLSGSAGRSTPVSASRNIRIPHAESALIDRKPYRMVQLKLLSSSHLEERGFYLMAANLKGNGSFAQSIAGKLGMTAQVAGANANSPLPKLQTASGKPSPADQMKYYDDPAPADTPKSEGEFDAKGTAFVVQLNGPPPTPLNAKGGDSDGGAVMDFPAWFSHLQDTLSASVTWSAVHEQAHRLLYRYAMWKVTTQWGIDPVPANVEFLFRFLGKAEDNQPAIEAMNKKIVKNGGELMTTSDTFYGRPNAMSWCAIASSMPIWKVLEKKSMKLMDDCDPQGDWGQKAGIQVTPSAKKDPTLDTVAIQSGDYIRVVGFRSPLSGHIATAIKAEPLADMNSKIWYVSGNAGRFGGGAVRIDGVQREKPPEAYSYGTASEHGNARNALNADIQTEEKHIKALQTAPMYDPQENKDLGAANKAMDDLLEMRNKGIKDSKTKIETYLTQIDAINKKLMAEAAKVRPDRQIDTVAKAEAALKPDTSGHAWLTLVVQTGGMGLHELTSASDPAMKSWMSKWRVTSIHGASK